MRHPAGETTDVKTCFRSKSGLVASFMKLYRQYFFISLCSLEVWMSRYIYYRLDLVRLAKGLTEELSEE